MTTGGLCTVPDCDRIVADAAVCSTCGHRLRQALADVPDLVAELAINAARLGRGGGREGGRDAETPLPVDLQAVIVRDALTDTLGVWAGETTPPGIAPPTGRPAALAVWLTVRLETIRHHPDGGQAVDEITAAVGAARDQVHGRNSATSVLAGLCPDCGIPVYARRGAREARCRRDGCGGTVEPDSWRESAIQRLADQPLTAADAARVLTVLDETITAARIRRWASPRPNPVDVDGTAEPRPAKLQPVDRDPHGRPRYRVADIRALLHKTGY